MNTANTAPAIPPAVRPAPAPATFAALLSSYSAYDLASTHAPLCERATDAARCDGVFDLGCLNEQRWHRVVFVHESHAGHLMCVQCAALHLAHLADEDNDSPAHLSAARAAVEGLVQS